MQLKKIERYSTYLPDRQIEAMMKLLKTNSKSEAIKKGEQLLSFFANICQPIPLIFTNNPERIYE